MGYLGLLYEKTRSISRSQTFDRSLFAACNPQQNILKWLIAGMPQLGRILAVQGNRNNALTAYENVFQHESRLYEAI